MNLRRSIIVFLQLIAIFQTGYARTTIESPEYDLDILEKGGKYGYCHYETREEAIGARFEDARLFYGGLARVKENKKWGFIDPNGEYVIPPQFDEAQSFSEGFAAVGFRQPDGNRIHGFIGPTGNWLVKPTFDVAYSFRGGLACVTTDGKKYGYIAKNGKYAIKPRFDYAEAFHEMKAVIIMNKKRGYIDIWGRVVADPIYEDAHFFNEGFAAVKKDGKWGYIDHRCNLVIPFQFEEALLFRQGRAAVRLTPYPNSKWEHIDTRGNLIEKTNRLNTTNKGIDRTR